MTVLQAKETATLKAAAVRIRQDILRMVRAGGAGHIGGAMSCADIMAAHFHFGVLSNHFTGCVHFLLIDKDNTGQDQCFGALPALGIAVLAKVLIQTNFH